MFAPLEVDPKLKEVTLNIGYIWNHAAKDQGCVGVVKTPEKKQTLEDKAVEYAKERFAASIQTPNRCGYFSMSI
jgi:hypothetical protein